MGALCLRSLEQVQTWTLRNADVEIQVERETGWIRSLYFKEKKIDLFQQLRQGIPGYIGGLKIYDELAEVWYNDLNDPFAVSNMRKSGQGVVFTKKFRNAPFSLQVALRLEADAFHWEVEATKDSPAVQDRSLRIYFLWPLIAGWEFWAPANQAEFTFDGMTSFEYMYVQIPYVNQKEIILPMISHFHKELDVGFSVMEPIEARVPAAKFQFANGEKCFTWGSMKKDARRIPMLEVVNYFIGLVGARPLKTKIMLMFHEGDWRPAVGKVFRKWNEFFVPACERIYEHAGCFTCEGVYSSDHLRRFRDFGIKTLEVHAHFEDYCDYYQDGKDKWFSMMVKEGYYRRNKIDPWQLQEFFYTHTGEELRKVYAQFSPEHKNSPQVRDIYLKRDEIRANLKKLAQAGIGCYWYFNYSDGFKPVVEKRFPDSIAKNEDGSYQSSGWNLCHNLNSDPRWSFGKFMIQSAQKIFADYPTLAGFFLDCFRHFEIDFAHDDGVTVVNHKPAYSINFSYEAIESVIKPMMIRMNLSSFANKPQSLRSMRWADGVLLEGSGDAAEEKFFWACLAKPYYLYWTNSEKTLDENLRRSVYYGCFPRFDTDPKLSYQKNKALYARYLPLFGQFKRRVFCFEPDPLRIPHGSRGRLYTLGDDYIAGIMSEFCGPQDKLVYGRTPHTVFRIKRGCDVGKVGVMYPGDKKWRSVKFLFDGTMISVPLASYKNCAIVRLFVTRKTGKKISDKKFQPHIDYCGDPQSAFDSRNEQ